MKPQAPSQSTPSARQPRPVLLSVAYPYAPMGPRAVGGAEVICSQLEASLSDLGFGSAVVAHADSAPCGVLYPTTVPPGTITEAVREQVEASQQAAMNRAFAENDIALVHMHGLDFHRYRVPPHIPVLVTLHLPLAWYPATIWSLPPNYSFVCVSENQRRTGPLEAQARVHVVPNGVPLPERNNLRAKGSYALMLARICPEKNLHAGFDAARDAHMPVILAGEAFPYEAHLRYLEQEIRPRLTAAGATHEARLPATAPAARFLGPVTGEEKQRLLQRAACLLLPSLAPETSSLVAMEALAAGVPVVGMAVGAIPEIVDDGLTGFLIQPGSNATRELSAALTRLPTLSRERCRDIAEARFPLSRMIGAYAGLYHRLLLASAPRCFGSPVPHPTALPDTPPVTPEPPPLTDLVVTELRSDTDLQDLMPEWSVLWESCPTATPFQHPAWLLPWWRQFGPDGRLRALALRCRDTGRLAALLPTYTYTPPDSGRGQLLLLGAGTSDYLDALVAPNAPSAAQQALSYLCSHRSGWDTMSLQQLRSSSPLLPAAAGLGLHLGDAEPCSFIDQAAELPPKLRTNLSRYRRLAATRGHLHCRLAATAAEALQDFEQLVAFHTRRWKQRGETGVLHDARVLAHHRESLPLLLAVGLLRLFHLTLNGETVGVLYGLADAPHHTGRGLFLYLIGFDDRFAALSPGTLLVHEAWLHAREHHFERLDLLRGGEGYKKHWGAQTELTHFLSTSPLSRH